MSNTGRNDFHKRLAAIDKKPNSGIRAKRSDRVGIYDYEEEKRRKARKFSWGRLFFWLAIGVVGLIGVKTFMVQRMGEEQYQARLIELREGEGWEPYAAIIAARDPLMIMIERTLFDAKTTDPEIQNAPQENLGASETAQ